MIVLGDESGYTVSEAQQTKLAAMEAMWETEPAPAPFNVIAIPNEEKMNNDFELQIPWVMGIIGTRSLDQANTGHPGDQGEEPRAHRLRHRGRQALDALRKNPLDPALKAAFEARKRTSASGCC